MAESDLGAYAHTLLDDVHSQAETTETDLQTAFAELVLDQFCADGLTEDARVVRFKEHGAAVNGWALSTDGGSLDLFLTEYAARADDGYKISRQDVLGSFRRLENFLTRCQSGQILAKDPGTEVADMCAAIGDAFDSVGTIRLVLVTNARSIMRDPLPPADLLGRPVTYELWDLRRLSNWASSGAKAEPIVAEFPEGIACLATPTTHEDYSVFLAIMPGQDLAELYSTYGGRLLELNVRAFLQVRNTVNRGILDTIRTHPQRFLAYNNGISATASYVDFDLQDGERVIRRIHNLQIVNGGQTTATVHHAHHNKIDVTEVLVQMKLTVVSPDQLDDIVPQISAYSNTQSRVTASDLKANSGFHVEIERIMRGLRAPAARGSHQETHWFYERARGQYATALAREGTRAQQRRFRASNPVSQRFTKSELAKYEHTWLMLPHLVSLGAEKNFVHFSRRMANNEAPPVDKEFCQHLIAKAILFRRTDKLVAAQNYGDYKANIVAYTISKVVHATRARIDLDRIWRDQDLSPALQEELVRVSAAVQKIIISPPPGRTHAGEWAKRPECWDAVRQLPWNLSPALREELADVDTYTEDLSMVRNTRPQDWRELAAWGSSEKKLDAGQQLVAEEIARALENGWDPAGKHVTAGVQMMRDSQDLGFRTVFGF